VDAGTEGNGGTGLLRNVQLFSGLSDELLERVAGRVGEVRVPAGQWVLRRGERADRLFVVRSGRIEIVDEGPPEVLVRVLRRGDVLGELALLGEGVRSASARARRDTELLTLDRQPFETLIREAPEFALALTHELGARLASSLAPMAIEPLPRTVAVIGLDPGAPAEEVARGLSATLERYGSVATLGEGTLETIEQAEADVERLILLGGRSPAEDWTATCLREADRLIAVATGESDHAWLAHASSLHGCELLVFAGSVPRQTFDRLGPRELQVVADPSRRADSLAALGRRIAGRSPGVVLSGGGARALAHIGVIDELRTAGVHIDRVAGVSLGSLVAAATAAEYSSEAMYEAFEQNFVRTNPTRDYVPPTYSMLRGLKVRKLLDDAFGELRIEELALRFFCVSCDLIAREAVVHRDGRLSDALYPSLAIPGVFPPMATPDGRLLVDGGVLDNLPVETMAASGTGPVIAVDVTGRTGQFERAERPMLAPLSRSIRHAFTGFEAQIPRLGETIVRSILVGSSDTVAAARRHADLTITPAVEDIGLMEWKALPRARELGRRAALDALEGAAELHARLGI
jgi:NTE family protein